jgi:Protein of unknown function (DUF1353)
MKRNNIIYSRFLDCFSGKIEMPLVEISSSEYDILACDYCVRLPKIDIWIPKHTRTNYASLGIAKIIFDVKNDTQLACAIHDFLYSGEAIDVIANAKCRYSMEWCEDRLFVDLLFRYILRCTGVSAIKSSAYYYAVRLFGASHFRDTKEVS